MHVLQNPGVRFGLVFMSSLSFVLLSQPNRSATSQVITNQAITNQATSPASKTGLDLSSVPASVESSRFSHSRVALKSSSEEASTVDSDVPVQISEGEGGRFNFQIWQNLSRDEFYLFIWDLNQGDDQEPAASYNFSSAAGAMNFFTCRYAREPLASCNMLVSSVSYDVPETCVFPWANCE